MIWQLSPFNLNNLLLWHFLENTQFRQRGHTLCGSLGTKNTDNRASSVSLALRRCRSSLDFAADEACESWICRERIRICSGILCPLVFSVALLKVRLVFQACWVQTDTPNYTLQKNLRLWDLHWYAASTWNVTAMQRRRDVSVKISVSYHSHTLWMILNIGFIFKYCGVLARHGLITVSATCLLSELRSVDAQL